MVTPNPTPTNQGQGDPANAAPFVSPEVTNQVPNAPATSQVEKYINNPGEGLAAFINDAHAAGYQYIDPNIITTIGHQMGNTNNAKLALAQIKQSLAIPNKQTQALFEPSAVAPEQTPSKVIQDHITNTAIAPWPIADIKKMQQTLIDSNYDGTSYAPKGAVADGKWDANWANAAYNYSLADHTQPGFGNTGARSLFSTIFNPGFLSYAIPLVTSVAKSLPGDVLKGLADGLKISTDGYAAVYDFIHKTPLDKSGGYDIANAVSNLGHKIEGQTPLTNDQYPKQGNTEALIHIANLALTVSTLGKVAEEVGLTAKAGIAAGKEAGAKNAGSALFTKVEPMSPKGPLNWVMNTALPDTQDGSRFAFTNWLKNSPTAMRIAPQITAKAKVGLDATATEIKNAYRVARRVAATPYSRPVTQIAGQLGSSISTAGLKLGIQGHTDNWMGDPNAPVAYQLDHLKPIAGMTGLGLNLLQMVAHGDTGVVPALSESTGNIFAQARSGISLALDRNGLLPDWERGSGASVKNTIKNLIASTKASDIPLTADDFYAHVLDQADQFAAQHAAESFVNQSIANKSLDINNHDAIHQAQLDKAHEIRHDEALMADARASYIQKPGLFAKDVANSMLEHRESSLKKYSSDLAAKLQANRVTQNGVMPHYDLLTGGLKAPTEDTSWMAQGIKDAQPDNVVKGRIGIQRYGLPTAEDAQAQALAFAQELQKAKPGYSAPTSIEGLKASSDGSEFGANATWQMPKSHLPGSATEAEADLRQKVMDYLGSELGRSVKDLAYVPTQDLIKLIAEKSDLLAHEIRLPANAPQSLIDAFARNKELGYKNVIGTDIGFIHHKPPLDLEALGTQQNLLTHTLDKWGINFTPMGDDTSVSSIHAKNGINDVVDAKKAEDPTSLGNAALWGNGNQLINYAQSMIKPSIGKAGSIAVSASASPLGKILTLKGLSLKNGGVWKKELDALIARGSYTDDTGKVFPIESMGDAKNALKKILVTDSNPQSWTRKEFIDAMTKKSNQPNGLVYVKFGHEVEPVAMSVKDASDLWYGMKKGLRSAPAYQSGTNVLSRLMNSTLGLDNVPLAIKGHRILDITGPIQNALIQARYLYSPRQAYLRVVKSALKGVNENMPYSMNPAVSLKELPQEAQDAAKALTQKIYGKNESALDLTAPETKEFASKDFFNIFDPQATLERTVHYVYQNMMDEKYAKASFNPLPADLKLKVETPATGVVETKPVFDEFGKPKIKTGTDNNYKISFIDKKTGKEVSKLLWNKDTGVIQSVRTDPALQGKGIASAMFANAQKVSRDNNIQSPIHSTILTEDGKAWKDALGKNDLLNFTPADEIALKKRVDAINNYGERTAAEKTLNGFFFPFSFEKTVIRELGAHLLDNPSTRLLTAGAIHVYNSTDGQKMDKWLKDNVPLWKEVEKFNPFYHGTGLGQFGGINRTPEGIIGAALYGGANIPDFSKVSDVDKVKLFVHMMQPKPVTNQASLKAAMSLVPAIRDLNNLFVGLPLTGNAPFSKVAGGEIRASVQDLAGQAFRAVHQLVQSEPKAFDSQGYQPYALQQTNAWALRDKYIAGLASALQANASGGNVTFLPETPGVGGLKVNRTNINKLVAQIYPDWNPNLQSYALARETAVTAERVSIQNSVKKVGPNLLSMYDNFTQGSDKVQGQIQKASNDPAFDYSKIVSNMATLRYWASWLAANDPNFPAFYAKYYASKYGPLKGL